MPLLLAYSNGLVVFPTVRDHGIPTAYASVQLSPASLDSLLSRLGARETDGLADSVFDLAPTTTDQHSLFFLVAGTSGGRVFQVRAALLAGDTLDARIPTTLRRLYALVSGFRLAGASPWTPDSIKVAIWPYEYAPDNPPVEWPSRLPPLSDPRWMRRPDPVVTEMGFLRLPFSDVPLLDSIITVRREKQAIGIGGHKWALSYRWVFPHEDEWAQIADRLDS